MTVSLNMALIESLLQDVSYTWHNSVTNENETINAIAVVKGIIANQGKNKGMVRAAKPKINYTVVRRNRHGFTARYNTMSLHDAAVAQVWRWVSFTIGTHPELPVTVTFDAPIDMTHDELRDFAKWCESIEDVVSKTINISEQHGLLRWSRLI